MATYSCKLVSVSPAGAGQVSCTVEQRVNAADPDPVRTITVVVPLTATNAEAIAAVQANIAADEAAKAAAQAAAAAATGRFGTMVGAVFGVTV